MAQRLEVPGVPPTPALSDAVHDVICQTTSYSAACYYAATHLLRRVTPRTVVMYTEFAAPAYQILRRCREVGVRTVAVQHGDVVDGLSSGMLHPRLGKTSVPDRTCVFGSSYANVLTSSGLYEAGSVLATGHVFRGLHGHKPRHDPDGHVLVLSQSFLSSACRMRFLETARHIRADDLRVKLHPYERANLGADDLPAGSRILPGSMTAFAAMDGARVVVGGSSSALLEARYLGFPVVAIESEGDRIRQPELRACMHIVQAGEDPNPAIATATDATTPATTPETLLDYFGVEPSRARFVAALNPEET